MVTSSDALQLRLVGAKAIKLGSCEWKSFWFQKVFFHPNVFLKITDKADN